MKKLLAILLSITVIGASMMALASCGGNGEADETTTTPVNETTAAPANETTAAPAGETTAAPADETTEAATEPAETDPPVDPYADYTKLYDDIDMESITGDAGFDNEGCENIFDDDPTTKWCLRPTAEDGSITVQWAMMSPVTLAGYAFTTANDSEDRNPEAWTLSAATSADGEYTVIATVTAGDLPWEFFTDSVIYPIDNPGEYQYYKLNITENFNGRDLYQFSELILLAGK